jgi:hypothetical protein
MEFADDITYAVCLLKITKRNDDDIMDLYLLLLRTLTESTANLAVALYTVITEAGDTAIPQHADNPPVILSFAALE